MIGICLPTRGLMNSFMVERLLEMSKGYVTKCYFAHGIGIPDCFNEPCSKALLDGCDIILVVEDDVVPPSNAIRLMLDALDDGYDIAFYDYYLEQGKAMRKAGGMVCGGTGCMMVKGEVMRELMPFSTDRIYDKNFQRIGRNNDPDPFAMQDTDFFVRAQESGYKLRCMGMADHYHLSSLGKHSSNRGWHHIRRLTGELEDVSPSE